MRHQYPPDTTMIVRKPLYGIPEAGTHWWATYYKLHKEKLSMVTSSYDPCLLITTKKEIFGVVGMQTDDTLLLGSEQFATLEEEELQRAYLSAKPREELSLTSSLIFNECVLTQNSDDTMTLLQKDQGKKLQLVNEKGEPSTGALGAMCPWSIYCIDLSIRSLVRPLCSCTAPEPNRGRYSYVEQAP